MGGLTGVICHTEIELMTFATPKKSSHHTTLTDCLVSLMPNFPQQLSKQGLLLTSDLFFTLEEVCEA